MSSETIAVYVDGKKHVNIQDWTRQELNDLLNVCRMEIHNQELIMSRPGKKPDADSRHLATLRQRENTIRAVLERRKQIDEVSQDGRQTQG